MKLDIFQTVPNWIRVAAITVLAIVTVALVGAQFSESLVSDPKTVSPQRLSQLEDQEKTLSLAYEFGFDPMIVAIARRLSSDAMRKNACACPTWRFIRSDEELAYTLLSIIQAESRGDYRAMNPGGPAYGLTQLLLTTAREHKQTVTTDELLTIPTNLSIAMDHFVELLTKYQGNVPLTVIAWNRGAGSVDLAIRLGRSPENGYGRTVLTQAVMRNAR